MPKVYYDKDAKLSYLKKRKIGIIGYGSQGHAQAQNLRDSGLDVTVRARKDSVRYKASIRDGFKPVTDEELAQSCDVIQILTQDELQAEIYNRAIKPHLKKGSALFFSHGFNIHFKQIIPPEYVDVILVAPKAPGHLVRRMYVEGRGVPSLLAIHQDASKKAKQIGLAYACGIGSTRAGVFETTFSEETETDLFGEQAVLCGGVSELIKAGFDTLVGAGYAPEVAYFECLHEMKLIVDLIHEGGIARMRYSISDTAEYGDITRGKRIITDETRKEMKKILHEIQTGEFAREWLLENKVNRPMFNLTREVEANHLIEKVGAKLRKMMPWIGSDKPID